MARRLAAIPATGASNAEPSTTNASSSKATTHNGGPYRKPALGVSNPTTAYGAPHSGQLAMVSGCTASCPHAPQASAPDFPRSHRLGRSTPAADASTHRATSPPATPPVHHAKVHSIASTPCPCIRSPVREISADYPCRPGLSLEPAMRPAHAAMFFCVLLPAAAAFAQTTEPDQAETQTQAQTQPRFLYELGLNIHADSIPHIDGGGDATATLTRSEFTLTWLASQRTRAIARFSNEFAYYDFEGAFRLDPVDGSPFGSFSRQNVDATVVHAINERWRVLGLAGFGLARERTADVGDSLIWRVGVGASYYVTRNISLGASFLVQSQLEGNVEVLPLPQIDATFEFDEQWSLELGTLSGATLTYQAFDELAFELKAGYNEREYRLDDSGFAPEGVFQDKSIDLRLGVNWKPIDGLEVNAGVGSQLWRRFKITDEDGNRLSRVETDPTIMLYAGVSYSF